MRHFQGWSIIFSAFGRSSSSTARKTWSRTFAAFFHFTALTSDILLVFSKSIFHLARKESRNASYFTSERHPHPSWYMYDWNRTTGSRAMNRRQEFLDSLYLDSTTVLNWTNRLSVNDSQTQSPEFSGQSFYLIFTPIRTVVLTIRRTAPNGTG
jgi:hypothetical protein